MSRLPVVSITDRQCSCARLFGVELLGLPKQEPRAIHDGPSHFSASLRNEVWACRVASNASRQPCDYEGATTSGHAARAHGSAATQETAAAATAQDGSEAVRSPECRCSLKPRVASASNHHLPTATSFVSLTPWCRDNAAPIRSSRHRRVRNLPKSRHAGRCSTLHRWAVTHVPRDSTGSCNGVSTHRSSSESFVLDAYDANIARD